MLKGILLAAILLACTGVGRTLSNARKRRMELLGELLAAMRVLRLRMLNSMEPLSVLLRKSEAGLFRELGQELWQGEELWWSWQRRRMDTRSSGLEPLNSGDLALLDDFFQSLGASGREEQNRLFSDTIAAMEEAQNQARKHFADASKVFTALGTLVGIGVCVLIV